MSGGDFDGHCYNRNFNVQLQSTSPMKTLLPKHLLLASAIFLCLARLQAQDDFTPTDSLETLTKKWEFSVSPYALLATQATDVGGERLRQSFNDLSSLTNFGFQLIAGIRYNRKYALTIDGTYADLGASQEEGFLKLELGIKQYIIDTRFGYEVYSNIDYSRQDDVVRGWSLETNIGGKFWRNDINLDYTIDIGIGDPISDRLDDTQQWWDLMIGVKSRIILSRTVLLGLMASVGGFGIDSSSKLAWDFTYTNTFKISKTIYVTAGFRTFQYKREDGVGDEALTTKVAVYGPLIGATFAF